MHMPIVKKKNINQSRFYYVHVPFANMRKLPTSTSEVVSQAYYSEQVNILEQNSDWIKIATTVDDYQGWIKNDQLVDRQDPFLSDASPKIAHVNRCSAHLYHVPDTTYGPLLTLPFEARLEVIEHQDARWIKTMTVDGRQGFIQRGDIVLNKELITMQQLPSFSLQFLGLPYTWGGRSSFGYDCSGFVQMLYRQIGIYLPRDAKDQIQWNGLHAIDISDLSPGDLLFFGLNSDKIGHVGMYLKQDQFIHATVAENAPYIHISRLSDPEWNGSGKWHYRAARTHYKVHHRDHREHREG